MLYPKLGNQDKIKVEHIRVKAAIEIVRCYLIDVIKQKGERHGQGKAKVLIKLAKQSMSKKLYREYGLNITDCFINVGFDQRFVDKTVEVLSMKVQEG